MAATGRQTWDGEQELRRCLADTAAQVKPTGTDLADRAITRARRSRRRGMAGLGVVVLLIAVTAGVWLPNREAEQPGRLGPVSDGLEDGITVEVAPPDQPPPLPFDASGEVMAELVADGPDGARQLATAGGEVVDLAGVRLAELTSVHRVGSGWAVAGSDQDLVGLWWVAPDHRQLPLVTRASALVVEHRRVAWSGVAGLWVAEVDPAGTLTGQTLLREDGSQPVGFLDEAVVVADVDRGDSRRWQLSYPDRGGADPGWGTEVLRFYRQLPDPPAGSGATPPTGPTGLGLVAPPARAGACLALLGADPGTGVGPTRCLTAELAPDGVAAVSPQGRHLLAQTTAGTLVMVDLHQLFAADPTTDRDAGVVAVPDLTALAGRPVWIADDRVLVPSGDGLVSISPGELAAGSADAVTAVLSDGASPLVVHPG